MIIRSLTLYILWMYIIVTLLTNLLEIVTVHVLTCTCSILHVSVYFSSIKWETLTGTHEYNISGVHSLLLIINLSCFKISVLFTLLSIFLFILHSFFSHSSYPGCFWSIPSSTTCSHHIIFIQNSQCNLKIKHFILLTYLMTVTKLLYDRNKLLYM